MQEKRIEWDENINVNSNLRIPSSIAVVTVAPAVNCCIHAWDAILCASCSIIIIMKRSFRQNITIIANRGR